MPDLGRPLIIGHRGASGYRPEHTEVAYRLAAQLGADYIEPDLVMSSDGVLVVRHEPEIGSTTDVATHPRFADRRSTRTIDGVAVTGWFADDFTLAELKTLRAVERLGELRPDSAAHDGQHEILTFEEALRLRETLSGEIGREIGIIPEIKHPTYLHGVGLDPETELVRLVTAFGLNSVAAPMWTQCFEVATLKALRERHGYRARTLLLMTQEGGPYDLAETGTTYAELSTPEALTGLSPWVDAIGPDRSQVISRRPDGSLGNPTTLVDAAHAAGVQVMPWTFRAENAFLPLDYRLGEDPGRHGRAVAEAQAFIDAGVDGLFCDHPDVCVTARDGVAGEG